MKIKKLAAICMAATIAIASIPLSASAHSNDKNYSIAVTSSNSGHHNGQFQNSYQAWEKKDNSTSSYVKANSGLSSFIAVIWGGWPNSETTDCTTYEIYSGSPRKSAVVRVGQKGVCPPRCVRAIWWRFCDSSCPDLCKIQRCNRHYDRRMES